MEGRTVGEKPQGVDRLKQSGSSRRPFYFRSAKNWMA
jgi:hypothetical protein